MTLDRNPYNSGAGPSAASASASSSGSMPYSAAPSSTVSPSSASGSTSGHSTSSSSSAGGRAASTMTAASAVGASSSAAMTSKAASLRSSVAGYSPTGSAGTSRPPSRSASHRSGAHSRNTSASQQRGEVDTRKVLPFLFDDAELDDVVVLVADMLSKLTQHNDSLPLHPASLTRFHSRATPNITLPAYLRRIAKYTSVEKCCMLILLVYIDRVCERMAGFTICGLTVHRFICAAVLCASKALCDAFNTNEHYSRVGGITLAEMNLLEKEFLNCIDWRLTCSGELLQCYYESLVRSHEGFVLAPPPEGMGEEPDQLGQHADALVGGRSGGGDDNDDDDIDMSAGGERGGGGLDNVAAGPSSLPAEPIPYRPPDAGMPHSATTDLPRAPWTPGTASGQRSGTAPDPGTTVGTLTSDRGPPYATAAPAPAEQHGSYGTSGASIQPSRGGSNTTPTAERSPSRAFDTGMGMLASPSKRRMASTGVMGAAGGDDERATKSPRFAPDGAGGGGGGGAGPPSSFRVSSSARE